MGSSREPQTGRKTSMPPRGQRPGFKRGRHNLPYWIAKQVVRDPLGFPEPCIALPADADDDTIGELCRSHTARLQQWIVDAQTRTEKDSLGTSKYDGSVLSACRVYQTHKMSRFHSVKHNTRKTYVDSLKVIEQTVGARQIRRLTTLDVQHWYDQWKKPAYEGGQERVDRAHDAVSMFRTVLWFMTALRVPECKLLAEELKAVKFEKGGAREQEMTYTQVTAFIRKALELGEAGVMPRDRALYMAISTAAMFELLLRQKDIIGERLTAEQLMRTKIPKGASVLKFDSFAWAGFFTWENVPGWIWRMKTSKSKYRAAAEFDLTRYGLLMPLLEAVPQAQRTGAIVKDETGRPVREGSYRRWFRQVAKAAGIPDEVWNMDTRAGGATEAEEAGAELELIQNALTHSEQRTTLRYVRRRSKKIAMVADIRQLDRDAKKPGGTG